MEKEKLKDESYEMGSNMFILFSCGKCGHILFVEEKPDLAKKLEKVAGMYCPACGEQDEDLWRLLGRYNKDELDVFPFMLCWNRTMNSEGIEIEGITHWMPYPKRRRYRL